MGVSLLFVFASLCVVAQPERIKAIFPAGTIMHQNIAYAGDTLKKHQLDIYLPAKATANTPLVIWVHGGAWMLNDKYADMGYMKTTIKTMLDKGYALASIDYRHSTTAAFPAQIQDCNQAVEYLHANAGKYKLDKSKFVLMGFSAGGHLASLLALSRNSTIPEFYAGGKKPSFVIKAVLDFYGPSDFLLFYGAADVNVVSTTPDKTPVGLLLGASPLNRPDISKQASPVTYVDKNDPPFFIVHGEKDQDVPPVQSYLLKSYLDVAGVKSELTYVKGAPHYGEMFDAEEVRAKLFAFLDAQFK
ncbi:alpha/beta hydrolase [Chryseolinea sp. Jin1]|uniref:Alpha/beta hydrolase n=2 Tax=Chryseolinea lacunae TaxID=2801331 RepID=A0ABS1KM30_9BACT|nr:alpha/beta hydrolase [Chryseolinea lacunae]